MTTAGGGGGELGTVFINVAPSIQGIGDQFVAAGRQAAKDLTEGLRQGMKEAPTRTGSDASVLDEVIAGKPVSTATRTAAQKAGKEIGTGLNAGVAEGMKTAPTTSGGGILSDVIAGKPVSSGTKAAAENLGKEVGTSISKGLTDTAAGGGVKDALKDLFKEPAEIIKSATKEWAGGVVDELKSGDVKGAFSDVGAVIENTTSMVGRLGDAIGLDLSSVTNFGTTAAKSMGDFGGDIQGVVDKIKGTSSDVKTFADTVKGIGSGDAGSRLGAVGKALGLIADNTKKLTGEDISGVTKPLQDVAETAAGIGEAGLAVRGLAEAMPLLSAAVIAAGPEIAVLLALAAAAGSIAYIWETMPHSDAEAQQRLHPVPPPGTFTPSPYAPVPTVVPPPVTRGAEEPTSIAGLLGGQLGGPVAGGASGRDSVPALLEPGEYVVRRDRASRYRGLLDALNFTHFDTGGPVTSGGDTTVPLKQNPDGTWTSPNPFWAHLIQRESGGNPSIFNRWDINAARGDPSQGLFQFTKSTWAAHGGLKYGPDPGRATPQQQAEIAANLIRANPSGSDWGAGMSGRESAGGLLAGLGPGGAGAGGGSNFYKDWYGTGAPGGGRNFYKDWYGSGAGTAGGFTGGGTAGGGGENIPLGTEGDPLYVTPSMAGVGGAAGAAGGAGVGSAGGGGVPGAEQFGGDIISGMFQELGFPDVFGKPFTQWGLWKTGMAGLKFGMALMQAMGGAGGAGGGSAGGPSAPAGLAGMLTAQRPGQGGANGAGKGTFGDLYISNDFRGGVGQVEKGAMQNITDGMTAASGATMPVGGAPVP
jgi:hypothetical protein